MTKSLEQAEELYEAVNQLIRVHQFRDRDYICCHDVSVAQCYAIETLVKRGPLRLQALANEMYLDKSTTSRVVDALLRKRYVHKSPDPSDQRAIQLSLTTEGEALHQKIHQDLINEEALMLKEVPTEIVNGAITIIRALTSAARARLGS